MSMIGCFRRLPATDLERLLASPEQIVDYLYEEESPGFGPYADLDVDKAWHGIHFLLTGQSWEGEPPLGFIVNGGEEVGEEDVGYGPARAFRPGEVAAIASALTGVTAEALTARFNPEALAGAEVYPDIWADEGMEAAGYVIGYYGMLQEFLAGAAEEGEGLLVWIS